MAKWKMAFDKPDIEVLFRESENGEDMHMRTDEFYAQYNDKPVWMKLGAMDNYGKKRYIWRPCRIGVYVEMDIPDC